jgi:hypothetical protein
MIYLVARLEHSCSSSHDIKAKSVECTATIRAPIIASGPLVANTSILAVSLATRAKRPERVPGLCPSSALSSSPAKFNANKSNFSTIWGIWGSGTSGEAKSGVRRMALLQAC